LGGGKVIAPQKNINSAKLNLASKAIITKSIEIIIKSQNAN
jgi:hypothetical protein